MTPHNSQRNETLDLGAFARVLEAPPVPPAASWRPWHIRLADGERARFETLCVVHGIRVFDVLDRQLADLAAVRLPGESQEDRRGYIAEYVAGFGGPDACGTWVYLPWESRAVRLLERDAYVEVITNRNRDKITAEEQRLLSTRRIGVMGLSVGGEAAVAVAQEHLCGELRLADFDVLDLSNLNRLGAGIDELGVNKAVIVARRVAKIDPYLDVKVHADGVTDANLAEFLDGLDLLIEETDGLPVKHAVRRHARERGLNVVFAGDERGFLSVEPYAHRPELRPFHGRVDAPQPSRDAYGTPAEFLRAVTEWLGGWAAVSERTRRSLEQVGATLCGYPQLAGEARYAAGQVAHVARRLLLGERLPPFIGHLDLEALLPRAGSEP